MGLCEAAGSIWQFESIKEVITKKEILAATHRNIVLVAVVLLQFRPGPHVNIALQVCGGIGHLNNKFHTFNIHYFAASAVKSQPESQSRNRRTFYEDLSEQFN